MTKDRKGRGSSGAARRRDALRRLDKELARTWLITVINPIVEGLRREKTFVDRENWTWRVSTGRFEHLWPAVSYVDARYRDNADAFLLQYRGVRAAIEKHDVALDELAVACLEVLNTLLGSELFRTAIDRAQQEASAAGISLEEARGAVPEEEWPKLLGEYVVNDIRSLPSHYATSRFWDVGGSLLLATRTSNALRPKFDSVVDRGRTVKNVVEDAIARLVDVRAEYTRRFALPPVPLTGTGEL